MIDDAVAADEPQRLAAGCGSAAARDPAQPGSAIRRCRAPTARIRTPPPAPAAATDSGGSGTDGRRREQRRERRRQRPGRAARRRTRRPPAPPSARSGTVPGAAPPDDADRGQRERHRPAVANEARRRDAGDAPAEGHEVVAGHHRGQRAEHQAIDEQRRRGNGRRAVCRASRGRCRTGRRGRTARGPRDRRRARRR